MTLKEDFYYLHFLRGGGMLMPHRFSKKSTSVGQEAENNETKA